MVPWKSTQGGFAYIWQSKWVGIIAIKTVRTQIHLLHVSDVLIAVASFDRKVPILVTRATPSVGPQRPLQKNRRALRMRMYTYVHGCARAHVVNSLEPISLMLSTGGVKAAPSRTPQIRQTTDDDDDFVIRIIGGAIVLRMIWWCTHVTHASPLLPLPTG